MESSQSQQRINQVRGHSSSLKSRQGLRSRAKQNDDKSIQRSKRSQSSSNYDYYSELKSSSKNSLKTSQVFKTSMASTLQIQEQAVTEPARLQSKCMFSKFVISIFVQFYDVKDAKDRAKLMELRLVSLVFDEAVMIGLKINLTQLLNRNEQLKDIIMINFSEDQRTEYQGLKQRKLDINEQLKEHLDKCKRKTPLFANIKSHAYLFKPNHLIIKPFFAVMILLDRFYTLNELNALVKKDSNRPFDFMNWSNDLQIVWRNKKHILKEKKLLESLHDFDVCNVKKSQMDLLEKLYANDPWMQVGLISRESKLSGHLFQWTQKVFEFIQVANHLKKFGIKDLEDQIADGQKREQISRQVLQNRNVKIIHEENKTQKV